MMPDDNPKQFENDADDYDQLAPVERQQMLQMDLEQKQELPNRFSVVEYLEKISKTPIKIDDDHLEKFSWLNTTRPLSLDDLKNLIIVCDFFTYCCINCLHMLPFLAEVEERYAKHEVVVIGIHSPKFENEKSLKNVANAIIRHDICHPVCNDTELKLWNQLSIVCWPTIAIIGPGSQLLFTLIGEVAIRTRLDHYLNISLEYFKNQLNFEKKSLLPIALLRDQPKCDGKILDSPTKVSLSVDGTKIAVANTRAHTVIVCSTSGIVHHRIGGPRSGFHDGKFEQVLFNYPQGITWIDEETFYVCDTENHAIRRVDLGKNIVETIAGNRTMGEDKIGGRIGREQPLNSPWDVIYDPCDQRLYIAMAGLHQIWTIILNSGGDHIHGNDYPTGSCVCFAGDGNEQKRNHRSALKASFAQPSGLCLRSRILYVADSESSSVRTVDLDSGTVGTLVGGNADPTDLFAFGDVDGKGSRCRLQHCMGICAGNDDEIFLADTFNHKIKKINIETKICEQIPILWNEKFDEPNGLCFLPEQSLLLVADTNNHRLVSVSLADYRAKIFNLIELNDEDGKSADVTDNTADLIIEQEMFEIKTQHNEAEIIISIGFTSDEMLKATPGARHRIFAYTDGDSEWQIEPSKMMVEDLKDIRFLVRAPQKKADDETTLIFEFNLNLCHSKENYCLLRKVNIRQPIRVVIDNDHQSKNVLAKKIVKIYI